MFQLSPDSIMVLSKVSAWITERQPINDKLEIECHKVPGGYALTRLVVPNIRTVTDNDGWYDVRQSIEICFSWIPYATNERPYGETSSKNMAVMFYDDFISSGKGPIRTEYGNVDDLQWILREHLVGGEISEAEFRATFSD